MDKIDSSSDSDDEELAKLKQVAVDISFIKPDVKSSKKNEAGQASLPSRRPSAIPVEDNSPLDVTPEFRQHVSTRLAGSLDTKLQVDAMWSAENQTQKQDEEEKMDFRLFSLSTPGGDFVNKTEHVQQKRPRAPSTSSDEDTKLQSAAVDASEVKKQKELVFPNRHTKGKLETWEIPAKKKRKKKKKKPKTETGTETKEVKSNGIENTVTEKADTEDIGDNTVKKKKKKKKKKKPQTETGSETKEVKEDDELTTTVKRNGIENTDTEKTDIEGIGDSTVKKKKRKRRKKKESNDIATCEISKEQS